MVDSTLQPSEVIGNLRARGSWRDTRTPAELKKFKAQRLVVETTGSEFTMFWAVNSSPLFNPVCFGKVDPNGEGSRISAGFELNKVMLLPIITTVAMALVWLITFRIFKLVISAIVLILVAYFLLRRRTSEPMRSLLIQELREAATLRVRKSEPFGSAMSTNGP